MSVVRTLSVEQMAVALHRTPKNVRAACAAGRIPPAFKRLGKWLAEERAFNEWLVGSDAPVEPLDARVSRLAAVVAGRGVAGEDDDG